MQQNLKRKIGIQREKGREKTALIQEKLLMVYMYVTKE